MKSLFRIKEEYAGIADMLIDAGGEITEELETALTINQDELQEKACQLAMIVKDMEYQAEYCKAEIDRISKLKKHIESSQDRLKNAISNAMQIYGISEIKLDTIKISFRKSEAVNVFNEAAVPDFLKELVYKTNKIEIGKLLKQGIEVPGATLEQRKNLQIK